MQQLNCHSALPSHDLQARAPTQMHCQHRTVLNQCDFAMLVCGEAESAVTTMSSTEN